MNHGSAIIVVEIERDPYSAVTVQYRQTIGAHTFGQDRPSFDVSSTFLDLNICRITALKYKGSLTFSL